MISPGRMLTSADGTQIYADASGDPAKPAVVFIHGFGVSSAAFDAIFDNPKWTEALYLVRYDTRGHGRSGMPIDAVAWESRHLAEDFEAVVDAYKLVRPFALGWSLGGSHLADVLSAHPASYLSGIIHLAAVPYMKEVPLAGSELALSCLPSLAQTTNVVAYQEAAVKFGKGCSKLASFNVVTQILGQIMIQPRAVTQFVITREQDETGFLKAGAEGIPFISIGGDADLLVDWKGAAPLMDGFTNKKFIELHGAEHMSWLTHDEELRKHIVAFIEANVEKLS